jgi:chromosome segregation ATPase
VSRQGDLEKIDRNIKDSEIRLKTFEVNIGTLKKEIDFLVQLEEQLESNISFLKKIKIVTLAEEYKKAKEDLKKTKIRITQLKSDRMINEKAHRELGLLLEKNKELYDKLAQQNENNVLQGKFGGGRRRV